MPTPPLIPILIVLLFGAFGILAWIVVIVSDRNTQQIERIKRDMSNDQVTNQQKFDAAAEQIKQLTTDLATAKAQIKSDFKTLNDELTALKEQNPTVDTTGFDTAMGSLGTSIHSLPGDVEAADTGSTSTTTDSGSTTDGGATSDAGGTNTPPTDVTPVGDGQPVPGL